MPDLRYPVGPFVYEGRATPDLRKAWTRQLAGAPALYWNAIQGLDAPQLDTPYRPDGWTVRQVVHHVADSHLNCYIRFRLALTENEPVVKPYDEKKWAELPDAKTGPVEVSLTLLDSAHRRWVALVESLDAAAFARTYRHPEFGLRTLDETLALYAWHTRHHAAHITALRARMGW